MAEEARDEMSEAFMREIGEQRARDEALAKEQAQQGQPGQPDAPTPEKFALVTSLKSMGHTMGAYRLALIESGIPNQVVDVYVRDWAWIHYYSSYYPHCGPDAPTA